ncbi:hypothetical protein GDO78_015847 [Eleutherodactylus coqui]|uniref:Uncharacterized protein n=1 Tax=Eleutherodactylus coqui TaxID=57060 RepID=A0A8J6BBA8_ELECQ|nr:hypothetical protein GDO78_015847 [Eleutherodactylus coqui]
MGRRTAAINMAVYPPTKTTAKTKSEKKVTAHHSRMMRRTMCQTTAAMTRPSPTTANCRHTILPRTVNRRRTISPRIVKCKWTVSQRTVNKNRGVSQRTANGKTSKN